MKTVRASSKYAVFFLVLPVLAGLQQDRTSLLERIEQLDKEIQSRSRELDWIHRKIEETEKSIRQGESLSMNLKARLERQRAGLKKRLRVLSRISREGLVGLLLGKDSIKNMRARLYYLQVLLGKDSGRIREYGNTIRKLNETHRDLEAKKKAFTELKGALLRAQQDAQRERKNKQALLEKIMHNEGMRRERLNESLQAIKHMKDMLSHPKKNTLVSGRAFRMARGRMICPVHARIKRGFGVLEDPVLKVEIRHPGLSFDTKVGQEIMAIFDGKVAYSGWFKAFGQVIILNHGGGFYSLYAHLSKIDVSDASEVRAGEIIGRTGDTGSVRKPKLYFEIRYKGRTINPSRWVRCAR
ncbi:MAG: peptidoglycan DD-metalloendopeptidase family protein [Deltaproteobacteria bacterium]|nr:peptidoglycan DD-metalloendopeptidase family protein [Deltaproteobacteria bacterium]